MSLPVFDAVLCLARRVIRLAVEGRGVQDGCLPVDRPRLKQAVAANEEDADDEPSDTPGHGNLVSQQERVEEGSAELTCSFLERAHKMGGRVSRVRKAIPSDEHNQYRGSDCRDPSQRTHGEVTADRA